MFRTIWSKTLRDYRIAALCWGLGIGVWLFLVYAIYEMAWTHSLASLQQMADQYRFLGESVAITTVNGTVTWEAAMMPLVLGIWTILAGAGMLRAAEQRGSLEVVLATPQPRWRLLAEQVASLATALVGVALCIALAAIAGEALTQTEIGIGGAILAGLNVSLAAFCYGMIALFFSQLLSSRGAAAGISGAVMVAGYLLENAGRSITGLGWMRWLSPFYYTNLSKPLIPGYGMNPGALLVLLLLSLALLGLSIWLFLRRDLGESAVPWWRFTFRRAQQSHRRPLEQTARELSLRFVGLRTLCAQRSLLLWWSAGLAFYALVETLVARGTEETIKQFYANSPVLSQLLGGIDVGTNEGFIALSVFLYGPLLLTLFALVLARGWAANLDNGRTELLLSTPQPRWRVTLESYASVVIAILLAPLVLWLGVLLGAGVTGLRINVGHLTEACFGVIPLELIVASLVYLLAPRLRAGAVMGIVGAFIAASYLAEFLYRFHSLPTWIISLSIFHQYSTPMTDGLQWGAALAMIGIALLLLGLGTALFRRSDLRQAE